MSTQRDHRDTATGNTVLASTYEHHSMLIVLIHTYHLRLFEADHPAYKAGPYCSIKDGPVYNISRVFWFFKVFKS